MPVPESKRKANDRWDKSNMSILSCKVRKQEAEQFRARAAEEGMSPNAILAGYVRSYIRRDIDDIDHD